MSADFPSMFCVLPRISEHLACSEPEKQRWNLLVRKSMSWSKRIRIRVGVCEPTLVISADDITEIRWHRYSRVTHRHPCTSVRGQKRMTDPQECIQRSVLHVLRDNHHRLTWRKKERERREKQRQMIMVENDAHHSSTQQAGCWGKACECERIFDSQAVHLGPMVT